MAGAAPTTKPAPFLGPLDTLDRGLLLAEGALSLVTVVAMILIAVAGAAVRLFHLEIAALAGADDLLLYGAIWAAFLGASFATRGRKHLAIDVLGRLLPDRGRRVVVAVASTLGGVVAFALARGIYQELQSITVHANEQFAQQLQSGIAHPDVDRSHEFQFIIPGGFLLISARLLLHAFHEFLCAQRPAPAPKAAPAAELPEDVAALKDAADPARVAPVSQASAAEIAIALVILAALVVAARGSVVLGPLALCAFGAALTLVVPLALRRRKGSLAPTAPREAEPPATFTVPQLALSVAGVAAVLLLARYGIANVERIPLGWGIAFFGVMAVLGAPLFTFLGGLGLFLWLHGSVDVPATALPNAVEDVLGQHFARMSVLPTIPVFTLAGYLMSEAKTPQRLVRVARAWLGWAPGGLAIVCLLTSSLFTVFSGASGITIVAIGGLLFPALLKDRYPEKFSLGLVTTGGALGITLPFCLPLIVYGIVAGLQEPTPGHERLDLQKFMFAGLLPGALVVLLFVLYAVAVALVARVPRSNNFDPREAFASLWEAKWELLVIVFLPIGLILFGPTTAAVLTAFYVLIIEVFVYKDLSLTRDVPRIIPESMVLVGAIFVKLCAATILTQYFVQAQTADHLFEYLTCGPPAVSYMHAHADTIGTCREAVDALAQAHQSSGGIIDSKLSFLIALNVFLLVVGMLMDIFSAIVVVVPLIAGIASHFDINPYHLGVVFLFNLEIGYLMPPMGLNLFIAGFRFNRPVPELYKVVPPFIAIFIVALLVTTYVPKLTLLTVPGQHETPAATQPAPGGTAPTPTGPTEPSNAAAAGDAAAGDAAAGADDCSEQRDNESFEDFDRRCNITGQHPEATHHPAAAPTPPPSAQDCAEQRDNESFDDFDRRCNITGQYGPDASSADSGAAAPDAG